VVESYYGFPENTVVLKSVDAPETDGKERVRHFVIAEDGTEFSSIEFAYEHLGCEDKRSAHKPPSNSTYQSTQKSADTDDGLPASSERYQKWARKKTEIERLEPSRFGFPLETVVMKDTSGRNAAHFIIGADGAEFTNLKEAHAHFSAAGKMQVQGRQGLNSQNSLKEGQTVLHPDHGIGVITGFNQAWTSVRFSSDSVSSQQSTSTPCRRKDLQHSTPQPTPQTAPQPTPQMTPQTTPKTAPKTTLPQTTTLTSKFDKWSWKEIAKKVPPSTYGFPDSVTCYVATSKSNKTHFLIVTADGEEFETLTEARAHLMLTVERIMSITCNVCNGGEREDALMLCSNERCDAATHYDCLGLRKIISGDWFCSDCGIGTPPCSQPKPSSPRRSTPAQTAGSPSPGGTR
jgi:hypothetical protein